jgi:hypothetical protein
MPNFYNGLFRRAMKKGRINSKKWLFGYKTNTQLLLSILAVIENLFCFQEFLFQKHLEAFRIK